MWINEKTLDVYRLHHEIRQAFPSTSFPTNMADRDFASFGVVPVTEVPAPIVDYTKNVTEGAPVYQNGWKQSWVVTDASAEEIAQRTEDKAAEVRAERSRLLAGCDWTQLGDAPGGVAAKFAVYRQLLRDLPGQPGFPWNVAWPTE